MTLDEPKHDLDWFLDVYTPTVLKPMGGWELRGSIVRRGGRSMGRCPLIAHDRSIKWQPSLGGRALGLDGEAITAIVNAADGEYCQPGSEHVRARLLAGLGLSEPGGERGSR